METKNGHELATLKVKVPARPGKTPLGIARKKSPSSVKRDKARMEKFLQRKTFQETWCPPVSSTPSIEKQTKQDLGIQDLANEEELTKDDTGESLKDANESNKEKDNNDSRIEINNKENEHMKPMTDEEYEAIFKKHFAPLYKFLNDLSIAAAGVIRDNNVKTEKIDKIETTKDGLEGAGEWAKQQKKSLLNKKE